MFTISWQFLVYSGNCFILNLHLKLHLQTITIVITGLDKHLLTLLLVRGSLTSTLTEETSWVVTMLGDQTTSTANSRDGEESCIRRAGGEESAV